jgi:hypothetical protein
VKIALTILCSLLFVLGQVATLSAPEISVGHVQKNCGCGGKMSCCQKASVPQPLTATAQASSQNQILSPVPAVEVRGVVPVGTASNSPTTPRLLTLGTTPIFARDCAWII